MLSYKIYGWESQFVIIAKLIYKQLLCIIYLIVACRLKLLALISP
jgi:hypothetical protein